MQFNNISISKIMYPYGGCFKAIVKNAFDAATAIINATKFNMNVLEGFSNKHLKSRI